MESDKEITEVPADEKTVAENEPILKRYFGSILVLFSYIVCTILLPFSLIFCLRVIQQYERAVVFRLGRLSKEGARGPGVLVVMPCVDSFQKVDLRIRTYSIPAQEVLTKDSVTVYVDAVVYYRIQNAAISVTNVENAHHSTRLLAQTTMRNMLSANNLHDILSDRDSITRKMMKLLDQTTDQWGVKLERVELKDVRLPIQLQRAMAAEAEATREARAKFIAAEGEQKSSKALKEAADVMASEPAALQLRYMQTLNILCSEKESKIIFPIPLDL